MAVILRIFIVIFMAATLWACQSQPAHRQQNRFDSGAQAAGSPFVQADGTRFMRHGRPYYYVGANLWYGAYLGASADGRARLETELDQLQAIGINNIRVLAASEKTPLSVAVNPAIHPTPGEYNEALLRGLDVLLDEMSERGMVAVLYLNHFWPWSGAIAPLTGDMSISPNVDDDWNELMQNSAAFFRSDQAQSEYQSLIGAVITRTNSINGKAYADDPTIMAWQLANEPRLSSGDEKYQHIDAYNDWVRTTVRFIKSLDANHLVSTGSEGAMGTLQDVDLYRKAHEAAGVDYLTFHMWPKDWGWFDVKKAEQTYRPAMATAKAYILRHLQVAKTLNMPVVLEAFGIERDNEGYNPNVGTVQRDRFYADVFRFVEQQATLGAPMAGTNFWAWGGAGRAQHRDFIWREEDPFTGDPPQEPQGLNSVFDVDQSTLDIISSHARFMNAL